MIVGGTSREQAGQSFEQAVEVLQLDVPHVPDPDDLTVGGVDRQAHLEPFRRQIAQYQSQLAARGFAAGGPLALRLFA